MLSVIHVLTAVLDAGLPGTREVSLVLGGMGAGASDFWQEAENSNTVIELSKKYFFKNDIYLFMPVDFLNQK
ncbi:hypothetical protein [Albibacterium bauzanense]|uniref:hypothetical protein n=1 Tax=Albibacterium bauzanense TaxID=653929 RepID=UPI00140498A1|nr:hypothetical protein [Albibacterium bauzanense]